MRKYRVFSPIFRIEIHLDKAKSYRITAPTAAHHCVFTSISVWTTLTMLKKCTVQNQDSNDLGFASRDLFK